MNPVNLVDNKKQKRGQKAAEPRGRLPPTDSPHGSQTLVEGVLPDHPEPYARRERRKNHRRPAEIRAGGLVDRFERRRVEDVEQVQERANSELPPLVESGR